MSAERFHIEVPGGLSISALRSGPAGAGWTLVYAPGAGSNLDDAFGAYAADRLEAADIAVVRFQFPYSEAKRKVPDRTPVLEATWRAVLETLQPQTQRLVAGGRSMGGRIASQVVAQGEPVDALALFAYPLHPPGQPDRRRDVHLRLLRVPTLFCSGDRDTFATVDELRLTAAMIPDARVHVLDGADHGFAVLKASGRRREDVWDDALGALLAYLEGLRD